MAEHPMETTVRTALWRQFGAAIDIVNAIPTSNIASTACLSS